MSLPNIWQLCLEAGVYVTTLRTWSASVKMKSISFHILAFTFSLGAFVGPLIASPFVGKEISSLYSLYGLLTGIASIPYLAIFINDLRKGQSGETGVNEEKSADDDDDDTNEKGEELKYRIVFLTLMGSFFFTTAAVELSFGSLLATYSVQKSDLGMGKTEAAYLTSLFWGTHTAARLIIIPVSYKVHPLRVLISNMTVTVIGFAVLVPFGGNSRLALQISSAVIGLGLGSLFATAYVWVEEKTPVSGKIAGFFTTAVAMAPLASIVIANLMDYVALDVFLYSIGGLVAISFIILCAAINISKVTC